MEKNKGETGYGYINDYFKQIATAKDVTTANAKIAEALKLICQQRCSCFDHYQPGGWYYRLRQTYHH